MINVVYLVLYVPAGGHTGDTGKAITTIQIPQVNMQQCLKNAQTYGNKGKVKDSYCIVGVMSK
ncbi:hypothetical protein Phab24_id048 [Acinetobacter phage Phab24]|nr:hypothetical protein Phab24_id048 [Acinetobacter phage Phab24]